MLLAWIAVILVTSLVGALLLWGLQPHPAALARRFEEEIDSDDPEPLARYLGVGASEGFSALLSERRLIRLLWREDTPDLLVTLWSIPDSPSVRFVSYRQGYLGFDQSVGRGMKDIAAWLGEQQEKSDLPPEATLWRSYAFVAVSNTGDRDLLIESEHGDHRRIRHRAYILEEDGKALAVPSASESLGGFLGDGEWSLRRRSLRGLKSGDENPALEFFSEVVARDSGDGRAHGWLGVLMAEHRDYRDKAGRHVAFASEFSPRDPLVRLIRAVRGGNDSLKRWAGEWRETLRAFPGATEHGAWLLCESLIVLRRMRAARALAEEFLLDPEEPRAQPRVLRWTDDRPRGATH